MTPSQTCVRREYHTILPHGEGEPQPLGQLLDEAVVALIAANRLWRAARLGGAHDLEDSVAAGASKANEWAIDSLRIWSAPNIVRTGAPSRKSTSVGETVIFTLSRAATCAGA